MPGLRQPGGTGTPVAEIVGLAPKPPVPPEPQLESTPADDGSNPVKLNQTKSNRMNQLNQRLAGRLFLDSCQFDQSRLNRASNCGRVTPHGGICFSDLTSGKPAGRGNVRRVDGE